MKMGILKPLTKTEIVFGGIFLGATISGIVISDDK